LEGAVNQEEPEYFGDESRVEVGVYLGEELVGGFSAVYAPPLQHLYLPLILRNE
jgi:hypothetical protein